MDARRSPHRVGNAHLADQSANFQRYSWSAQRRPDLRQYDLKPARCQRITVSGFTIVSALMVFGATRYSPTKIRRSMALKAVSSAGAVAGC
jgi:hypothetical protein